MGRLGLPALGLFFVIWIGSAVWNSADEAAVPPDSAFPRIPQPSEAGEITTRCGSGGCWREMVLIAKEPYTERSLADALGVAPERCEPPDLWTLRKTCAGISGNRTGLRVYIRYSPLISS